VRETHNESSFRYFLTQDRRRAKRSNRSLLLVLVALRHGVGRGATLTDEESSMLFTALGACLRDIDIVGWYRQDRIVAGILAQAIKVSTDVPRSIAQRISTGLSRRLPVTDAERLRVRVVTLGGVRAQASQ
jgi:hypothetical protein